MKKEIKKKSNVSSAERSKRIFIVFTAIFLSCVIIVGLVFGIIALIKNKNAVMKYRGIYLSEGVANYLSASYKYDFMKTLNRLGVDSYDADFFWESEAEEGVTWGELLAINTERYLKRVIIGTYLFDKNTRLNKDDKEVIKRAVSDVIEYRVGSRAAFDEMASDMGFTYRDFEKAVEMLYKYEMAQTVVFGYEGSSLAGGSFDAECNEYYESAYSKVLLMIVRTDGETITDPDSGQLTFSEYDAAAKAQAEAEIAYISKLIYNAENYPDSAVEQMNPKAFADMILVDYPTGTVNDSEGYYFSSQSSYSLEFYQGSADVVRTALALEVGHYAEVELEGVGTCFMYKCPLDSGAYKRTTISHFFTDFYDDAAGYIYSQSVDAYIGDVTVKDRYDRNAVITIPYSFELAVTFG